MRVLYVAVGEAFSDGSSASRELLGRARGLARLGHEVHIATKGPGFPLPSADALDGVKVVCLSRFLPPSAPRLAAAPALLMAGRRIRPEIVVERCSGLGGEGALVARRLSVPLVLDVASPLQPAAAGLANRLDRALLGGRIRRWRESAISQAAKLVTPSPELVPDSIPADKVTEIPWGVDSERFDPEKVEPHESLADLVGERSMVICTLGLRPWNGVKEIARAAKTLLIEQGRRDVVFVLLGDGPLAEWARRFSVQEDLQESFCCIGPVAPEDLPRYLVGARVAIAPFDTAAHPYGRLGLNSLAYPILEAMAMALPVVTCDLPPLSRIVRDGEDGILYREGESHALAGALNRLLDDRWLAGDRGWRGRDRAIAEFSLQKQSERLDAVLRSVVG